MKIDKTTTIKLSSTEVKNIIADWLISQGYKVSPGDVTLNVGMEYMDDIYQDYSVPCFKGCTAIMKGDSK